jgi:hypothetical protein
MGKRVLFVSALVGALLSSSIAFAKDPTVKQLKAARKEVAVDGAILGLEARVWRDAKPESPPADAPLAAVIKLKTEGNARLPVGIRVDRVWVIKGSELWSPAEHKDEMEATEPGQPTTFMNIQVGGGPKWKPGTKVVCVVRITMSDGGEGLLKVSGVAISAAP